MSWPIRADWSSFINLAGVAVQKNTYVINTNFIIGMYVYDSLGLDNCGSWNQFHMFNRQHVLSLNIHVLEASPSDVKRQKEEKPGKEKKHFQAGRYSSWVWGRS